jgi:hypothetical protein
MGSSRPKVVGCSTRRRARRSRRRYSSRAHQLLELAIARPKLVVGFVAVALSGLASIPFPDDVKGRDARARARRVSD